MEEDQITHVLIGKTEGATLMTKGKLLREFLTKNGKTKG